jgi:hypothetical protein
VREYAPNPVIELSGYTPTTDFWATSIRLMNAGILASAINGHGEDELVKGFNYTIDQDIFSGEHTAVEWAEFVMSINHVLWLLHDLNEARGIEYLEPVLQALSKLYYEWHNKALDTLKDEDLSTYLRITD